MSLFTTIYFGILIFSFIVTSILIVPFISLLYKLKFRRRTQFTINMHGKVLQTFDKLHNWKAGTPVGGGLLIVVVVAVLFFILFYSFKRFGIYINSAYNVENEILIIFFTFVSFGLLGFYDDLMKFFRIKQRRLFGLNFKTKFALQWLLALLAAGLIYAQLGIDVIHIPSTNLNFHLGWWYVPFAAFIIVTFANAYNITDGLDGLSTGLLMICLFALWAISSTVLDTVISLFIALWLGSLIAFLYFNVYPARIWLGDVGALSFGATLAVLGLLLGKPLAIFIIGGLFVAEGASSLIQIISRRFFHRRVFPAAPIHLSLQKIGWEEPKIVFRAWLAGVMVSILGLWLATL